jgi:thiamine pyrophosphokinase
MHLSDTAVVVIGGGPLAPTAITRADLVIAADGGLDVAVAAGIHPGVLVGDLDSISPAGLRWADSHDVTVERFPVDKDRTDTALAIERAISSGLGHLVVLGGAGTDRLDHLLGTLGVLGHESLAGFESVAARLGAHRIWIAHPGRTVELGEPEDTTLSLLAAHGPCNGVTITGVRWPLDNAELPAGTTLGISNEVVDDVTISCSSGVLTVIVPPAVVR